MNHKIIQHSITLLLMLSVLLPINTFAQAGALDLSFNTDGKVTTAIGTGQADGQSIAIQADGKIVVTGYVISGSSQDLAVVRYNTDGSLDTSFSNDGKVTTSVGTGLTVGQSIVIQADGKIVVAGFTNGVATNFDFAVVRYNTDGSLDNSFDTDGKVSTDFGADYDYGNSITIQADGKIVVAGYSRTVVGLYYDFAVVRYNTDGSLDNSFDSDGKVTTPNGNENEYGNAIAIQTDGKIVVAGASYNGANNDFAVVRYNTNGSLDNSFDTDGKLTTSIGNSSEYGNAITIQTDGKIVVAGASYNGVNFDFAVVRYNTNGSLDNSFDTDGKLTTDFSASTDYGYAIVIQTDGKIVVAGSGFSSIVSNDFAVVRYNSNGSLDSTFDTDGKVTTTIIGDDYGQAIAIQTDGKIVVAGYSSNGPNRYFTLTRYLSTNIPLPITLSSFTGKIIENASLLNWITESEQNNRHFLIQRSSDAIHFETIGTVNSKAENGNSNTELDYFYTDLESFFGGQGGREAVVFYRIQQIDLDGKYTFSNIISLANSHIGTLSIYPNPATNDIQLNNIKNVKSIKILSMGGNEIMHLKEPSSKNISVQHLANGQYLLLVDDDVKTTTFKFEKK